MPNADFAVENHGTVVMVRVLSDAAREWVDAHVALDSWQWMGDAFACEPRMVASLVDGMLDDGLIQLTQQRETR